MGESERVGTGDSGSKPLVDLSRLAAKFSPNPSWDVSVAVATAL